MNFFWSGSGSSQAQKQKQEQIVDQSYANGTLFMAMSTIQSLALNLDARQSQFHSKEFGGYDNHDYSYKNKDQLIGQAISQIILLDASKKNMEHTHGRYQLPQSYDMTRTIDKLNYFGGIFQSKGESQCVGLIKDMINILNGKYGQLYSYQILDILKKRTPQTRTGTGEFINQNMSKFMGEGNRIHDDRNKVLEKNYQNPSDIQFKQNKKNTRSQYEQQANQDMEIQVEGSSSMGGQKMHEGECQQGSSDTRGSKINGCQIGGQQNGGKYQQGSYYTRGTDPSKKKR